MSCVTALFIKLASLPAVVFIKHRAKSVIESRGRFSWMWGK
ncbi:hypothetical protein VCRA2119O48_210057 [Vibrio crassostreae]|nr:hypothetical protein VCRA2119O48_210057 [Vibrio crassostreae]CAK3502878.1 hypothetical protein VCRA213O314_40145 [Vibrio crassostreae]CAK3572626.1 hypothetical protein VCRA2123O74_110089 [Vibrio crassostreae]